MKSKFMCIEKSSSALVYEKKWLPMVNYSDWQPFFASTLERGKIDVVQPVLIGNEYAIGAHRVLICRIE